MLDHPPTVFVLGQQPLGNLQQVLDVPSPPPLPAPPFWQVYLLESPWIGISALVVLGVIVLLWHARRDQARLGVIRSGPLVIVAGLWALLAGIVQTPHEQMRAATRQLIGAVAKADLPGLREQLTRDARLNYFGGLPLQGIIDRVENLLSPGKQYHVRDYAIEALQTQLTNTAASNSGGAPLGIIQVKVRVTPESWNFPHRSWWKLEMVQSPGGRWHTSQITPLEIQGVR